MSDQLERWRRQLDRCLRLRTNYSRRPPRPLTGIEREALEARREAEEIESVLARIERESL